MDRIGVLGVRQTEVELHPHVRVVQAVVGHPFFGRPVTAEERLRVFTAGVALVRQ
jgi:hypothetical protein